MKAGFFSSKAREHENGFWLVESTLYGDMVSTKGAFNWGRDVIGLVFRRPIASSFFAMILTAKPTALTSTNMGVQLTKLANRLNIAEIKMFTTVVCQSDQKSLARTIIQSRLGTNHPVNSFDNTDDAINWLSENIKQYQEYLGS